MDKYTLEQYNRGMKKIYFLILFFIPNITYANPMFAEHKQNSIGFYIAQSTGHGDLGHLVFPWDWEINPATFVMLQYSQPTEIFRLPARINFNLMQNFAYRHDDGKSFGAIGVSWDIVLIKWCNWYFGIGAGPYMRDSGDEYVESRLVFGERVFIGTSISTNARAEIFTQHFSNGDFTEINRGFNFVGMAINYSF